MWKTLQNIRMCDTCGLFGWGLSSELHKVMYSLKLQIDQINQENHANDAIKLHSSGIIKFVSSTSSYMNSANTLEYLVHISCVGNNIARSKFYR